MCLLLFSCTRTLLGDTGVNLLYYRSCCHNMNSNMTTTILENDQTGFLLKVCIVTQLTNLDLSFLPYTKYNLRKNKFSYFSIYKHILSCIWSSRFISDKHLMKTNILIVGFKLAIYCIIYTARKHMRWRLTHNHCNFFLLYYDLLFSNLTYIV